MGGNLVLTHPVGAPLRLTNTGTKNYRSLQQLRWVRTCFFIQLIWKSSIESFKNLVMTQNMRGKKHAREVVAMWDEIGMISALKSYIKGNTTPGYLEDFISFQMTPRRSSSWKKKALSDNSGVSKAHLSCFSAELVSERASYDND